MPPDRSSDAQRRQRDPQSCNSCRSKKLKCDRQRPCSNCTSRRLSCDYVGARSTVPVEAGLIAIENDLYAQNVALKARIERLERAVFEQPSKLDRDTKRTTQASSTNSNSDTNGDGAALDVRWLEGVGNRIGDVLPTTSDDMQVTIEASGRFLSAATLTSKSRPIVLPTYSVAMAYLASYEQHADIVQPIMHLPNTREMFNSVFNKLEGQQAVTPGSIALMLAICACVELWGVRIPRLFDAFPNGDKMMTALADQALFAFENGRISSQISIELVQAAILLMFHLGHLEGISLQCRLLHSNAITMARTLRLHKIDASREKAGMESRSKAIQLEVGRRMWWHLAATDWLFACMEGPHEGTYSIQPHQMAVNLPRNINHDDLIARKIDFNRPDDELTAMTFHLQRIKLAVICREVIDRCSSHSLVTGLEKIPYDKVIALDAKFSALIDGIPKSLFASVGNSRFDSDFPTTSESQRTIQRLLTSLLVHTRRCRLHMPFLLRLQSNSRYVYSRQVALESARRVFEAWNIFQAEDTSGAAAASYRLGSILGLVLYATTVLVIDFCINRDEIVDENQAIEVRNAIKVAEDAKGSSSIAAAFWESLMAVLSKHQVDLPANNRVNDSTINTASTTRHNSMEYGSDAISFNGSGKPVPNGYLNGDQIMDDNANFDDIWQQLVENQYLTDPHSWDAFLNDIDMNAT